MNSDGGIQINRLLEVFGKIPGTHKSIIAPYDCRVGLLIDPEHCVANIHVHAVRRPDDSALYVRVDLQIVATHPNGLLGTDKALTEVRYAHDVLIGQFLSIFTDEAKESFKPA